MNVDRYLGEEPNGKSIRQYRVLYALLAGSGLKIGEVLGPEVESISIDFRKHSTFGSPFGKA